MMTLFVNGLNTKLRNAMASHPLKSYQHAQELALDFEKEIDIKRIGYDRLVMRFQEEINELKTQNLNGPLSFK